MADGGDGKDINLLMVKDRDDWICQQDISKLRTVLHARLKVYAFWSIGYDVYHKNTGCLKGTVAKRGHQP